MAQGRIEVVIVWDENGNCECGTDKDAAIERFKEQVTDEFEGIDGLRTMKLTLTVPLPKVIEAAASFADEEEVVAIDDAEISE